MDFLTREISGWASLIVQPRVHPMAAHVVQKIVRAGRSRSAILAAYLSLGSWRLRGSDLFAHAAMMLQFINAECVA